MTPNISKIIQTMSNIVADVMTSFQSDFENFDRSLLGVSEEDLSLIHI